MFTQMPIDIPHNVRECIYSFSSQNITITGSSQKVGHVREWYSGNRN